MKDGQNWNLFRKEEEGNGCSVANWQSPLHKQLHFMPFLYPCDGLGSSGTLVISLHFGSMKSIKRMGVESWGPKFES